MVPVKISPVILYFPCSFLTQYAPFLFQPQRRKRHLFQQCRLLGLSYYYVFLACQVCRIMGFVTSLCLSLFKFVTIRCLLPIMPLVACRVCRSIELTGCSFRRQIKSNTWQINFIQISVADPQLLLCRSGYRI